MKTLAVILLVLCLAACGGSNTKEHVSESEYAACLAAHGNFINHTRLKELQIISQWQQAQQRVAQGIFLDMFSTPPRDLIVDVRAITEAATCIQIESEPDVRPGVILLNGAPVHSYAVVDKTPEVVVSADSLLEIALEYEFENVLLHRLGYTVSKR